MATQQQEEGQVSTPCFDFWFLVFLPHALPSATRFPSRLLSYMRKKNVNLNTGTSFAIGIFSHIFNFDLECTLMALETPPQGNATVYTTVLILFVP